MRNANLHSAKVNKNDEFYTQLSDIEKELKNYKDFFKGKTVYCNCDDCFESNFFKYFALNFAHLGLKKLIATCYDASSVAGTEEPSIWGDDSIKELTEKKAYKIEIAELITDTDGNGLIDVADVANIIREKKLATLLDGDGDFRSPECLALLEECDVVVTNPPFSLFREFVATMVKYNKKFLVIGNLNNLTYKEFFPLIRDNEVWTGYTMNGVGTHWFEIPDNSYKTGKIKEENGKRYASIGDAIWWTNIETTKRHEKLIPDLYKKYNANDYPTYDNYNAIEVNKVANIPVDYKGVMGVPITFITHYNPDEFEIVSFRKGEDGKDLVFTRERESSTVLSYPCQTAIPGLIKNAEGKVNGKITYARITIRRK